MSFVAARGVYWNSAVSKALAISLSACFLRNYRLELAPTQLLARRGAARDAAAAARLQQARIRLGESVLRSISGTSQPQ